VCFLGALGRALLGLFFFFFEIENFPMPFVEATDPVDPQSVLYCPRFTPGSPPPADHIFQPSTATEWILLAYPPIFSCFTLCFFSPFLPGCPSRFRGRGPVSLLTHHRRPGESHLSSVLTDATKTYCRRALPLHPRFTSPRFFNRPFPPPAPKLRDLRFLFLLRLLAPRISSP